MKVQHARVRSSIGLSLVLLPLLTVLSCSSPEVVKVLPVLDGEPDVENYRGTALSGPVPSDAALPTGPHFVVRVRYAIFGMVPIAGLEPLGSRTKLNLDLRSESVLLSAPRLVRWGQVGERDMELAMPPALLAKSQRSGQLDSFLAPGLTSSFTWTFKGQSQKLESLCLYVDSRRTEEGEILFEPAFELRGELANEERQNAGGKPEPGEVDLASELVLLDSPMRLGHELVVALPVPYQVRDGGVLTAVLRVDPAPILGDPGYPAHLRALEACRLDLAASLEQQRKPDSRTGPKASVESVRMMLAAAASTPESQRESFFSLARVTEALVVQDLVLVAEIPFITELARKAQDEIPAEGGPDSRALGLELDLAALSLLYQPERFRRLSPAVRSVLIRHLGGVALRKDSVRDLIAKSKKVEDWHVILLEENRQLASDSSSVVSRRATEWLENRASERTTATEDAR